MFFAVAGVANGFTTNLHNDRLDITSLNAVSSSRRAFMENAMAAATVMAIGGAMPAFADDVGDLSMPTADEQAAQVRLLY